MSAALGNYVSDTASDLRIFMSADKAFEFPWFIPWFILWIVVLAGLVPGIGGLVTSRSAVTAEGLPVTVQTISATRAVATSTLVLLGVIALRAAIIFSIQ